MKDLLIIGAGGCGRDTAWLVERINTWHMDFNLNKEWNLIGFIDNNPDLIGKIIDGYKVVGDNGYLLKQNRKTHIVCAVANPRDRMRTIKFLENNGFLFFPILVDPSAVVSDRSKLNDGTIVFTNAFVSIDCRINKHVIIGVGTTVGHDTVIDDFVSIYPGAHISGNVSVKRGAEIGTGACIIQGIAIGEQSVIGMCASVIGEVEDCCTVVGNPAKKVFKHKYWNYDLSQSFME